MKKEPVTDEYVTQAIIIALKIHKEHTKGDILVFLAGKSDIHSGLLDLLF